MRKILIADDDPVCREILSQILMSGSYEVVAYTSGTDFLSGFKSQFKDLNKPVAVFLDVMLGDMTGIDVLGQIRGYDVTKDIPVIMLSANSRVEVRAIHGGPEPSLFLEKPFIAPTVLSALDSVLLATTTASK